MSDHDSEASRSSVRSVMKAPYRRRLVRKLHNTALEKRYGAFWVFLTPEAVAINRARQAHLASLRLPLENKSVLEVGAGIGLQTSFFEDRGCSITSTDGRPENVAEMARRYPQRTTRVLELDPPGDITSFGHFDICFCYGTLYHLSRPAEALQALSQVADLILLETCVTPGLDDTENVVPETASVVNQARSGQGSRPTRPWVIRHLKEYWGNGYVTVTQPLNSDFPVNWSAPTSPSGNLRSVFVGSRHPLDNPLLVPHPVDLQTH